MSYGSLIPVIDLSEGGMSKSREEGLRKELDDMGV